MTVELLLEAGADPNANTNSEGNSPLHLVAKWMEKIDESYSPTAKLLLEYGARLDSLNKLQQTPLDVWKEKHERSGKIISPPDWMNPTVLPLSYWCARTIRKSKILYHQKLPESLAEFVLKLEGGDEAILFCPSPTLV